MMQYLQRQDRFSKDFQFQNLSDCLIDRLPYLQYIQFQYKNPTMGEKLNVKVILGGRQRQYTLDYKHEDTFAKVEIKSILKIINRFINDINLLVNNYLNIWIVSNNGKQNLFKLRKNNTTINLTQNENGEFQIKIVLEDIEDKQNLLKFFHNNSQQYTRLSSNINKIIEESKQQQKKRGQKCMRPIDIAYFFADPLVTVTKNGIIPKYEVSYQLQYDKFIELVKKQEFGNNFRIEMMVATKINIKNTLFDGASILHFACHGKKNKGNLQIQSQTSVGELVDLQHSQFMNLLDIRTALPKLIIFNVCYSSVLAKMISSSKRIITIGYNDEAKDIYCQEFTKQFYLGLFKNRQPVRQLFHKIKDKIIQKNPAQGKKLQIFPVVPFPDQEADEFFTNTQSKLNFIKKWTFSESMRKNDSLGVKCQMFTFIKQYLTDDYRISYFFLKGQKHSGKSDFMKKTRIYIMNRKVFTQDFTIDLKSINGNYIETILQLRLQKQDLINKKMHELKELSKQRRTNPLLIFDHTQKILKLQYGKFVQFLQNRFVKQLRYGKIVIITNNITPIIKQQADIFKGAHFHMKTSPNIQRTEFTNFIERYASQDIKSSALKIFDSKLCPDLKLLKAIKSSTSQRQFAQQCQKEESMGVNSYQSLNLQYISQSLKQFQKEFQEFYKCANIKIEDNDYIFLSTIYMEIDLQIPQHYTNLECTKQKASNQIKNLMEKFDTFTRGIFKIFKSQEILFNQMKNKIPIKNLFHLSLKIGAFIYVYNDLINLFEVHLLNCQKLYVLVSGFYIDELKKDSDFHEIVTSYHLKVLLTLYSYYTEKQKNINFKKFPTKDEKIQEAILVKKSQIIIDQIMSQFDKRQYQMSHSALKSLFLINNMAQQLHYNRDYSLFTQNQRTHRQSEVLEYSSQQGPDLEEQAGIIDHHHQRILTYWKAFKDIQKCRQYIQRYDFILRQQSIIMIEILIIKQIVYNLRKIDQIFDRRQSFLSQNMTVYINYYIQIMEKIHSDRIFSNKQKNGLFYYHNSESIKPLYQQYLKAFIKTYFGLSKRKQSLSKQYSLPIFYQLIQLCEESHSISGISSIKKQIQLHVNKQFFNIWTCTTFIAQPLAYQQGGRQVKCNIKRYQNHVYNFLYNFYEKQLDKEVKFQIKCMNEQVLWKYEKAKRNLIQLVICDIREQSQKVYLQADFGKSMPQYIRALPLPKAPIVIYFGANVQIIEQIYNKMQTIAIWISVKNFFEKKPSTQKDKQKKNQRNEQIEVMSESKRLGIYYSILQYFYCSFCRHFFNGKHTLFVEQVKNSFQLAKAQAVIKTKLLYSSSKQFIFENQIEYAIGKMDCNIRYLMTSHNCQQLLRKPAYQFIYKQNKKEQKKKMEFKQVEPKKQYQDKKQKKVKNQQTAKKYKIRAQKIYEIGCNLQICQLLMQLEKIRQKGQRQKKQQKQKKQVHFNIMIYYKSEPMLTFYLRTLKIKLIKSQTFIVNSQVNNRTYQNYRKQMNDQFNQSNFNQIYESSEDNIGLIIPFINLQENLFAEEMRSGNTVKNSLIRMFFTQKRYTQTANMHKIYSIEENYKQMRSEYEHYFLQCKNLKPNASQRQLYERYKKVINSSSSSLQDLKIAIQK